MTYGYVPPRAGAGSVGGGADRWWWVAPAGGTVAVPGLAYLDLAAFGEGWPPAFLLGYLVPLALVGAGWFGERTERLRPRRVVLAAVGCTVAYGLTDMVIGILAVWWVVTSFAGAF
ncbi:hypothetical protein ABT354_12660 [Streptomyces sp. NPDC000594]|uniref:hypothetical protein n=1 Tax=Streptomyces sp. NPDC000594 TaxID=3154261 RepID=UPI003322A14C